MNDEEKLVTIKPLPEDEPKDKKISRKKPGRKAKPKKPKIEKHTVTEARRQALLKARLAKVEKRKQRQAEMKKIADQASDAMSGSLPSPKPNKEHPDKNHIDGRIGDLENQLQTLNQQLAKLMSGGVFKEGAQTAQTEVQQPTELRHRDITEPVDSFMSVSNGGESRQKVAPEHRNMEPVPLEPKFRRPEPFFF